MNLSEMIITDVIAYNRINIPQGTKRKRSNRPQWAIAVKTGGKTTYYNNGIEYLSDSRHICILSEGSSYAFECLEPGECLMLEFKCNINATDFLCIETDYTDEIIRLFETAEASTVYKPNGWKMQAFASLYSIFSYLLREPENKKSRERELISPAVKYITDNFNNSGITNDYLASLCSISTVYFRKIFLRCYGISPIAYINSIRIEKAKELLLSDYKSLEQICYCVGYNSVYSFSKMFKSKVGVAPGRYTDFISRK